MLVWLIGLALAAIPETIAPWLPSADELMWFVLTYDAGVFLVFLLDALIAARSFALVVRRIERRGEAPSPERVVRVL